MANFRDSDDLAKGVQWVLNSSNRGDISDNCLKKVLSSYSQHSVALKYIEEYNQALAFKHYKI